MAARLSDFTMTKVDGPGMISPAHFISNGKKCDKPTPISAMISGLCRNLSSIDRPERSRYGIVVL